MELGTWGIWQPTAKTSPEVVIEAEKLGYGTWWLGVSPPAPLTQVEELLDATERIVVATGIVNMWSEDATAIAAAYHRIEAKHPGRFALGVGIGHPEAVAQYTSPYERIVSYLDELAAADVPAARTILAALGPKVMKLAGERTAGAHPYFTTPAHTAQSRAILGPGPLLAPEHKVILDTDPERARAAARPVLGFYNRLVNYRKSWLNCGFTEADLAGEGSDALVDATILHGDVATVAAGLREHLDAGADHVCIQVVAGDVSATHRALAEALG